MAVHGGSGVSFGVIEQLRRARPEAKFLELVHRLDRETSGLLLLVLWLNARKQHAPRAVLDDDDRARLRQEVGRIERQIEQLVDRIINADSPALTSAYENRVRSLETEKAEIAEKMSNCGRVLPEFDDHFRTALEFLKNPKTLWYSKALEDKRALLKLAFADIYRYVADPRTATDADIARAARDTVPRVWPLFWGFRIMVGCSLLMLGLYGWAFVANARGRAGHRGLLRAALWAWPLPWIASQCGWLISEYGRQPWTVAGLLPTFLAASAHDAAAVMVSLGTFIGLYALLFATGIFLIVRCVRRGPEALSA